MDRNLPLLRAALCAGVLSASGAAAAWPDTAMGAYGAFGRTWHSDGGTQAPSIGLVVPWRGWTPWTPGAGTTWHLDFFLSQWRAPRSSFDLDSNSYTQLGAAGTWRHRLREGSSPWFVEAGLGATLLDRRYTTPERRFGTRFNFVSQLGFGRSFGSDGRHELALRFQHYSNAGIKSPNPGEDFLHLRYARRF